MQSTRADIQANRAGFAFHDIRLGFWAGIVGIATIMIIGGKTVWMVAIIVGLVVGLLSGSDESVTTPRQGLRFGAINGVVAGAAWVVGPLPRRLWVRPLG